MAPRTEGWLPGEGLADQGLQRAEVPLGQILEPAPAGGEAASAESNPATEPQQVLVILPQLELHRPDQPGSPASASAAWPRLPPASTSARKPIPLSRWVTVLRSQPRSAGRRLHVEPVPAERSSTAASPPGSAPGPRSPCSSLRRSSAVSTSRSASATARRRQFCSSRTLPGQAIPLQREQASSDRPPPTRFRRGLLAGRGRRAAPRPVPLPQRRQPQDDAFQPEVAGPPGTTPRTRRARGPGCSRRPPGRPPTSAARRRPGARSGPAARAEACPGARLAVSPISSRKMSRRRPARSSPRSPTRP